MQTQREALDVKVADLKDLLRRHKVSVDVSSLGNFSYTRPVGSSGDCREVVVIPMRGGIKPLAVVPARVAGALLGNAWRVEPEMTVTGFKCSGRLLPHLLVHEDTVMLYYLRQEIGVVLYLDVLLRKLRQR